MHFITKLKRVSRQEKLRVWLQLQLWL